MSVKSHISLLKLQQLIKSRLEDAFPLACWVTAEISEMKVNYSGHCYLELVEKGGANQVPKAKVSAVIWRSSYGALSSYFRSATGRGIAEGMNVMVKVNVSYHELYGLSLVITDIDPLYTLGDMERQRQETISRLQEEGVFDMNRSLDLPRVLQRIAVVSSRNAAGYQDFMNELRASGYHFHVTLFDSFMQGHAAEESVIAAMESVLDNLEDFDAVVVIRGGGSQSDLAAFDSYRLCCHVAQFPLPVLTGIGHDKDQSVADLVACVSLKTPTAVAAYLVSNLVEFENWLENSHNEIAGHAGRLLDEEKSRLRNSAFMLSRTEDSMTRGLDMKLEKLSSALTLYSRDVRIKARNDIEQLAARLSRVTGDMIVAEKAKLDMYGKIAETRDPSNILALGFAIVRKEGKAVRNSAMLTTGDNVNISFARGIVDAEIK